MLISLGFANFCSKLQLKQKPTDLEQFKVSGFLAYALYNAFKFQNFDLKLSRILPHCLKVMAPLPKILKNGQLFGKNVISKVVA